MEAHCHAYAGLTLRSSIALPELRSAPNQTNAVSISLGPAIVQGTSDRAWTQRCPEDGEDWLLLAPTETGYVVRFVGGADFFVDEGTIRIAPVPDATPETLRHLLLDHVLPRYLAWTDHLVLHASAVRVPDGRVVLFMGESGEGKSTLAAGFAAHCSGELLSDDCVVLERSADTTVAIPTYTGLRLWPDSLAALHPEHVAGAAAVASYSDKRRVTPAVHATATEPHPVAAIFELAGWDDTEAAWFESLEPEKACSAVMRNAFQAVADPRRGLRLVARAADVARRVPIATFDYPRLYDWLPRASAAILERLPPCDPATVRRPHDEARPC